MARDYAKYNGKRRGPNKNSRYRGIYILLFFFIVIVASGYWVYVHTLRGATTENSQLMRVLVNFKETFHFKNNEDSHAKAHAQPVAEKHEEVRFDFYDELQNMQMRTPTVSEDKPVNQANSAPKVLTAAAPAKETLPPKEVPPPAEDKSGFAVRIGIFDNMNLASEMRISLLLLGVDAEIVKVGSVYRLQPGIFPTMAKAKEVQKKLQQKGIDNIVIEKV